MYASCFITGEQRRYKDNTGSYGRNKTIKHWRAWEVAIRYSDIDLNDDVIAGGKTSNTILDINWYSTKKTRFTMNYIFVSTDNNNYENPDIGVTCSD